ncbi:MAG: DUF1704 domain-containing protein [Candidatus Gracilibacteria bacterium]|nr:DUF1704 domain-containing protein [Candidatus Gracilibacteria bacterium]
MFFKTYGILGQNERNLSYIKGKNTSFARYLADSKLRTKEFLQSKNIPVPENFYVIKKHSQLLDLDLSILKPPFVVKPNTGYGGNGIYVIDNMDSVGNYITNTGEILSKRRLMQHFRDILDGFFSLSGNKDQVVIERKVELDESIALIGKYGLPDIRVIVYNMIPIIAMLRVPTEESAGKANLHVGACGVGIEVGTGKLTHITSKNKIIKTIPGIGDIRGLELPHWDKVLELTSSLQQITGIGYLACDIVLDKDKGPLLLEVNIRPGLSVQNANLMPLGARLKKVEGITVTSVDKGVRLAKDLFGSDLGEKIKNITGNILVGPKEFITIFSGEKQFKYTANIQIVQNASLIDREFLLKILKIGEEEGEELKNIKLKYKILGQERETNFKIRDLDGVNIILGKTALKGFYIDPFKYKKGELPQDVSDLTTDSKNVIIRKNYENQLHKIDDALSDIGKKVTIIGKLAPTNLLEEKIKFTVSRGEYIPQFKYNEINIDFDALRKQLEEIEIGDLPLSGIFNRKKGELENKINFLEAFKYQNTKDITKYSEELFGGVREDVLEFAQQEVLKRGASEEESEKMYFPEIVTFVKNFNHIYGLDLKVIEDDIVSRFKMKGDTLVVRRGTIIGKKDLRAVVAHEIEGHYLRRLNGREKLFKIFAQGTAYYMTDEEGIAIYNQHRFLSDKDLRYYTMFDRYVCINYALNHSYSELIDFLRDYYNENYEEIFTFISRIKRGLERVDENGFFIKDLMYANGFYGIKDFVEGGGDLKKMYFGKVGLIDLEEIYESNFLFDKPNNNKIPIFL